jgi:hypothetical protein
MPLTGQVPATPRPPRRRGVSFASPRGAGVSGPSALVIGLLLAAAGGALALLAPRDDDGGGPVALTLAAAFGLAGAALAVQGARGLAARRRRDRLLAERPGEPWLADHPWRRAGTVDETGREARRVLAGGGVLTLVASGLAAAVLPTASWPELLVPALVFGAFLLVALFLLGRGVYLVLRRARHGVAELAFGRFPFLLGERLEVALLREPGTPRLDGLTATLACVEERWVEREEQDGDSPGRTRTRRGLERRELWSETRPVALVAGARLPIAFDLPRPGGEAVGTALAADPPRYWELTLSADLPGIDFGATFLVPVYENLRADPSPLDPNALLPLPHRGRGLG